MFWEILWLSAFRSSNLLPCIHGVFMADEKGNVLKKTIAVLEKAGRQKKQTIWLDLAKRLNKRSRGRISVNLWKIDSMAKKLKGKTVVVPGKVLGKGELNSEISIAALSFSKEAREQIEKKGKALSLVELAESDAKPGEMVIIA